VTYLFVIFLFVGTWAMFAIIGGERQRRLDDLKTRHQIQRHAGHGDSGSLQLHSGNPGSGESPRRKAA
jgi:hypothetical protein